MISDDGLVVDGERRAILDGTVSLFVTPPSPAHDDITELRLLPSEARSLAAILVRAADLQELSSADGLCLSESRQVGQETRERLMLKEYAASIT